MNGTQRQLLFAARVTLLFTAIVLTGLTYLAFTPLDRVRTVRAHYEHMHRPSPSTEAALRRITRRDLIENVLIRSGAVLFLSINVWALYRIQKRIAQPAV
jgi:uncharacterized membrane protein